MFKIYKKAKNYFLYTVVFAAAFSISSHITVLFSWRGPLQGRATAAPLPFTPVAHAETVGDSGDSGDVVGGGDVGGNDDGDSDGNGGASDSGDSGGDSGDSGGDSGGGGAGGAGSDGGGGSGW